MVELLIVGLFDLVGHGKGESFGRLDEVVEKGAKDRVDSTVGGEAELEFLEVLFRDIEANLAEGLRMEFVRGLRFFCHNTVKVESALGMISTLG